MRLMSIRQAITEMVILVIVVAATAAIAVPAAMAGRAHPARPPALVHVATNSNQRLVNVRPRRESAMRSMLDVKRARSTSPR